MGKSTSYRDHLTSSCHFTDKTPEAQRGEVICSRSHSRTFCPQAPALFFSVHLVSADKLPINASTLSWTCQSTLSSFHDHPVGQPVTGGVHMCSNRTSCYLGIRSNCWHSPRHPTNGLGAKSPYKPCVSTSRQRNGLIASIRHLILIPQRG